MAIQSRVTSTDDGLELYLWVLLGEGDEFVLYKLTNAATAARAAAVTKGDSFQLPHSISGHCECVMQ